MLKINFKESIANFLNLSYYVSICSSIVLISIQVGFRCKYNDKSIFSEQDLDKHQFNLPIYAFN